MAVQAGFRTRHITTLRLLPLPLYAGTQPIRQTCTPILIIEAINMIIDAILLLIIFTIYLDVNIIYLNLNTSQVEF